MKGTPSLAVVVLCSLFLLGCTGGRSGFESGWAGVITSEDTLYIASRDGRVFAVPVGGRVPLWTFPPAGRNCVNSFEGETLGAIYSTPALSYRTPEPVDDVEVPAPEPGVVEEAPALIPVPVADRLYVAAFFQEKGGEQGKLYALDAATGCLEWEFDGIEGPIVAGVTVVEDLNDQIVILVGTSDGTLYALDDIGSQVEERWRYTTQGKIWSTPTVSGDTVYVASFDHHVYAIALRDGRDKWPVPFEAKGAIISSPLVAEGKVFVGSFDRKLYALDASNGFEAWVSPFEADAWFWSSPITDGKWIYVASLEGKVYALDPGGGRLQWTFPEEGRIAPVYSSPVLVDDKLAVTSEDGKLYVLSPENGREDQRSSGQVVGGKVRAPLAAQEGSVFLHVLDQTVRGYNLTSGGSSWEFSTEK